MRAVLVDDEPPARALIHEFAADVDRIEIVAECGNGRDAIDTIREVDPDLVFLDVQMPGLDGFDVIERLDVLPYIIFSTAYEEFAVRAFEAGAVDYLLKPYGRDRFRTAVDRVRARFDETQGQPSSAYLERVAELMQTVRGTEAPAADRQTPEADSRPLQRLYVRHGEKITPVPLDTVQWIEAAGDYTKLHTDDKTYLCSLGIGALRERLDDARFLRVHRSFIVALPAIDHLRSDGSGGYVAHLHDGTQVRVSRSYADRIRRRIV